MVGSGSGRHAPLYFLFFLSGASGLIYEVVWVREFASVFGNSVFSAAIVTAVFMSGLASGGWVAGAWADERFASDRAAPLRAYGWCEAGVGVAALGTAALLPHLEGLSARLSTYTHESNGWYALSLGSSLLRYGVAVVLLTPITAAMGATLTLLARHVIADDVNRAAAEIGLLYGFNTAGAAAGCLATDLVLVPHIGLFATACVASLGNLVAAFAAGRLAARLTPPSGRARATSSPPPAPVRSPMPRAALGAAAALLFSGIGGMGLEIVWFRYLISMLGPYREVFSTMLGIMLIGMWLGALTAGQVERRWGRAESLYMAAQAMLAVSALAPLAFLTRRGFVTWASHTWASVSASSDWLRSLASTAIAAGPTALVVGTPAFFMGFAYPLANGVAQERASTVGRRAGLLYAANTVGAVIGAVGTGFFLLPRFGMQKSALILVGSGLVSAFAMVTTSRARASGVVAGSAVLALSAFVAFARLPADRLLRQTIPPANLGERLLAASEGIGETIIVTEQPGVAIRLITNGHSMSTTSIAARRYMALFAHMALLQIERPTTALVICFGVGNTLRSTLAYPGLEHVDVVDISEHVLEHAHYFAGTGRSPLEDPRVHVHVNDGRQHLRMVPDRSYDLITAEPPPISYAGVGALYSVEFYRLARSRLKAHGVMTHWLPIEQVEESASRSLVSAFLEVFPNAVLLGGHDHNLILVGVNDDNPFRFDPDRVAARLLELPAVAQDLASVEAGNVAELAGTIVASASELHRASGGAEPVTDDYPILEYFSGQLYAPHPPARDLFRPLESLAAFCPTCATSASLGAMGADIPTYLSLLSHYYGSALFRGEEHVPPTSLSIGPRERAVLRRSAYLRDVLGPPDAALR